MATSLLSNLFAGTPPNDVTKHTLSLNEREEIVSLLQSSIQCIQNGSCDPVIYQTMGALHQYTASCAGLSNWITPSKERRQRPAFVAQDNTIDQHRDALAYGWLEELSSNGDDDRVTWDPILALLVQKEHDDEPCLWITREILSDANHRYHLDEKKDRDDTLLEDRTPTELETLHSIPVKRKLRSCRYQSFYGDHRLLLDLKAPYACPQIVLQCPTARVAELWVKCLLSAKKKASEKVGDANLETIEMVYSSLSIMPSVSTEGDDDDDNSKKEQSRRGPSKTQINIDVIDDNDDGDGFPEETNEFGSVKPLAEKLQEAEDRKRAQLIADREERKQRQEQETKKFLKLQEEEKERERLQTESLQKKKKEKLAEQELEKKQLQETLIREQQDAAKRKKEEEDHRERLAKIEKGVEKIVQLETLKFEERKQENLTKISKEPIKPKGPLTAAEKQKLRMEREIAARERAEAERKRIEIEYEQAKKDRVEQRRRELEEKRKLAREEQRKKELRQKQKFLESERRKEAMKAAAMKPVAKKASSGVFTSTAKVTPGAAVSKDNTKGNLWFSLDKQMSAFEVADEERKRKEAEKKMEEEAKAKSEEDPEDARKRIAEEARQRLVQDEAKKLAKENEGLRKKPEEAKITTYYQQQELGQKGWSTGQKSHSSPKASNSNDHISQTTQPYQQAHRPISPTSPNSSLHQRSYQEQHQSGSSPIASGSSSNRVQAHARTWQNMKQPQVSQQNAHMNQQQQTGMPMGISHRPGVTTMPGYQTKQHPAAAFGSTVPLHQPKVMHPHPPLRTGQVPPASPHIYQPSAKTPTNPLQSQHQEIFLGQASIGQPSTSQSYMGQPPMGQSPIGKPSTGPQPMGQQPSGQSSTGKAPMRQPEATEMQQTDGESSESVLKRNVLLNWGLVPPAMQVLKPVDQLLCSVHMVFPPAFGVLGHDYFSTWKSILPSDLSSPNGSLEETKLKKNVRKIRFFLHPDKLPHDLTDEQQFLCKLLWDVVNDAFEEHKKSKEELDWM